MKQTIYLPVLHSFENENVYTGSLGELRFKITPAIRLTESKEIDRLQSSLLAECWNGPLCYEKSEIQTRRSFPLSADGRIALRDWLEEQVR